MALLLQARLKAICVNLPLGVPNLPQEHAWRLAFLSQSDALWGESGGYPLPLVRVLFGAAWRSRNSIMGVATSMPVAFSSPAMPGDELTSSTSGHSGVRPSV